MTDRRFPVFVQERVITRLVLRLVKQTDAHIALREWYPPAVTARGYGDLGRVTRRGVQLADKAVGRRHLLQPYGSGTGPHRAAMSSKASHARSGGEDAVRIERQMTSTTSVSSYPPLPPRIV
jgi:hypothetical protein